MSSQISDQKTSLEDWGHGLKVSLCERCDWQFISSKESSFRRCPHCFHQSVVELSSETGEQVLIPPPEMFLPPAIPTGQVNGIFRSFIEGLWFAPSDLSVYNLVQRTTLLYLPIWLVDSSVQASWQAEAGFDYQVLSHQDRFDENRGGWSSQQVKETRIRWEPRLGWLRRNFQNITSPALNEHAVLMRQVGQYDLSQSKAYEPVELAEVNFTAVLPNRNISDSWPDARMGMQTVAAKECQQACQADHLQNFTWEPEFSNKHWTLLLVPLYSSYYCDDEGTIRALFINGQSGKLFGVRRASLKRAQKISVLMLGIATIIFLFSMIFTFAGALMPLMLGFGGIGIILALLIGLSAFVPLVMVWTTNRKT